MWFPHGVPAPERYLENQLISRDNCSSVSARRGSDPRSVIQLCMRLWTDFGPKRALGSSVPSARAQEMRR